MTPEQLMEIPGIGEKMVEKIQLSVAAHFQSLESQQAAEDGEIPAEGEICRGVHAEEYASDEEIVERRTGGSRGRGNGDCEASDARPSNGRGSASRRSHECCCRRNRSGAPAAPTGEGINRETDDGQ